MKEKKASQESKTCCKSYRWKYVCLLFSLRQNNSLSFFLLQKLLELTSTHDFSHRNFLLKCQRKSVGGRQGGGGEGKYKPKEKPRIKEMTEKTDSKERLKRKKHSEVTCPFHSADNAAAQHRWPQPDKSICHGQNKDSAKFCYVILSGWTQLH